MHHDFHSLAIESPRRQAMPIAVFPGLTLTGAKVWDVLSNPSAQAEAEQAIHERYRTPFVLTAMDLSAEAEAFGCALWHGENEVPSVTGRLVTCRGQAQQLSVPRAGDKRTAVHIEAVRRLRSLPDHPVVVAGCIGPFSLAARLVGVSEAMELTVTEPDLIAAVLEKCVAFLIEYIRAFQSAGADAVLMAEPAAGLLSPRSMALHSSRPIRTIGEMVSGNRFALILHNCAAKLLHLPAMLETGLKAFHFGAPMDMRAALDTVPPDVIVAGNLDPSAVFCQSSPDQVRARTTELLAVAQAHPNCVLSSGCDLPAQTPLANLDAFFAAAR